MNSGVLQIHLKPADEDKIQFEFWQGETLLGEHSHEIPGIFRKFMSESYSYPSDASETGEEVLRNFLRDPDRDFELWIPTEKGPLHAQWQARRKLNLRTQLDQAGQDNQEVTIRRLAEAEGKEILSFSRIGRTLFFDLQAGILSPVSNWQGWQYADFFDNRRLFDEDFSEEEDLEDWSSGEIGEKRHQEIFRFYQEPLATSLEEFHHKPFIFLPPEGNLLEKDILFSVQNAQTQPLESPCRLRVSLLKSEDPEKMKVKLEGAFSEQVFSFDHHPLLFWLRARLEQALELSHLKQRDKDILREAMCNLVLEPGKDKIKREKIVRETLKKLPERYDVRSAARHYLKSFCHFLDGAQEAFQIFAAPGLWSIGKIKIRALLAVFSLSFLFLGKEVSNLDEEGQAAVDKEKALTGLALFKRELDRVGADLYFDQKAIRVSKLDFIMDAARKSGQDWFEIHPEIKLDNRTLSQQELETLLDHQGFLIKEDGVVLIDANSNEILRKLERFLKQKAESGSQKSKEYVNVPALEIFDWMVLKKLGIKFRLSGEEEDRLDKLLRFKKLPSKKLPVKFQGTLRDYQKEGYDWLAFLYEHRLGACLADDMGLGKTVQAIAFLGGLHEGQIVSLPPDRQRPHLVVMPASLIFNWESEIQKFYPDFKVLQYVGQERITDFEKYDLILTTYDILRRDMNQFKERAFHVILFDETQMVKNLFSARANAARNLKARFKICMTGTPLENHLGEYYSVIDLCVPGLFGNYESFKSQMKKDELGFLLQRTRPFVLRRTKDNILKELPPKVESDMYLALTDQQKWLYAKTVEEVKSNIRTAYHDKTEAQARVMALTGMLRLRQICLSPALVNANPQEISPKIEFLIIKLEELKEENHSALVFSQFTSFLDIVGHELQKKKIDYYRLDGKTPLRKRRDQVEAFQAGEGPSVFLISLKAGGFGLNLTRANYVFHLDPWWNPAVDRQASDRAHRIGQDKPVFIQRMLMRHTIEEKVMALRNSKWELFRAVMNEEAPSLGAASLSRADFEFLLS